MKIGNGSTLKNQSGAALVVALIMMIVLTLIGLASTFTSTLEMKLSGNKRGSTDAFYAADSGVQTVMGKIENFNLTAKYSVANKYHYSQDSTNLNPTRAEIIILHDTTQSGAPRGSGTSAIHFGFEHFLIESRGEDQNDLSLIKSSSIIQQKVVRLVPTQQGGY